jgi:hypothetical protein
MRAVSAASLAEPATASFAVYMLWGRVLFSTGVLIYMCGIFKRGCKRAAMHFPCIAYVFSFRVHAPTHNHFMTHPFVDLGLPAV